VNRPKDKQSAQMNGMSANVLRGLSESYHNADKQFTRNEGEKSVDCLMAELEVIQLAVKSPRWYLTLTLPF
jgi:hypothetical protein